MKAVPKIQYVSGHVTSIEGATQTRGITSDKSSHVIALMEINDVNAGPVFLHNVTIIGDAADEKLREHQQIEIAVSVNKPIMELTSNCMGTTSSHRSTVYALRSNGGQWHGQDVALLLGKRHQDIGKGGARALLILSPIFAFMVATVIFAGPAIFMVIAMLKMRSNGREHRELYPEIEDIRALLEANTTIRI